MRRILLLLAAGAVAFGIVTLVALEGREVVVLRSIGTDGAARDTRTWLAEDQGAPLIEAANPERDFYRHILSNPSVQLVRNGGVQQYKATVLPQPYGHDLIRARLREKYGWADWWIGFLADTSASLAIRLDPPSPS